MADDKKYYYLKLKDSFFEDDSMILLESMQDGYLYSNILLKLYLRSLKNEGKLMFNDRIPYSIEMIATITRHKVGVVEKAIDIFKQLSLIEVLDNGAMYMLDIQNYIGRSSTEADRQRDYYNRINKDKNMLIESKKPCKKSYKKSCKNSTPEIEIEKEIDIELEKEINIKGKSPIDLIIETYTSNENLIETINDFLKMRKSIKKPATERALKDIFKKLDRMGNTDLDKIMLLEQSITNCWQDIFPLRQQQNTQQPKSNNPFLDMLRNEGKYDD